MYTQEAKLFELIKAALTSLGFSFTDDNLNTTAILNGDVTIDLGATNTVLGTIDADTSALAALISAGKLLVTETSASAMLSALGTINTSADNIEADADATRVAAQALAALVSSGKLLVTETSGADTKTAAQALAALISGGKFLTTETSGAAIKTAVEATKTAIDTINSNIATIKADVALIKTAVSKKAIAAANATGNGSAQTITASGSNVTITNRSATGTLALTVGALTFTLYAGEGIDDIDFTAFESISVTATSGVPYTYIIKG